MRILSRILGVVFILVGLAGFASHDLLGMHLSAAHNLIHLITGAVVLFVGIKGSDRAIRNTAKTIGFAYVLMGLTGFLFNADTLSLKGMEGQYADNLWKLIPGQLELSLSDHVTHVLLGAVFLVVGFMSYGADLRFEETTREIRERVASR